MCFIVLDVELQAITVINILQYLNHKKVLHANILMQNVLQQQIPPRSFRQGGVNRGEFDSVSPKRVCHFSAELPLKTLCDRADFLICAKTDGNMQ